MADEFLKRNIEMRNLKSDQSSPETPPDKYKFIWGENVKALFEIVKKGQTLLLKEKLATIKELDFLCCTVGYRHASIPMDTDGMTLADWANKIGNEDILELLYQHAMKLSENDSVDHLTAKLTFNRKAEIDDLLDRCDKNDKDDLEPSLFISIGFYLAALKGCFYAFQKIFERREKNDKQAIKPDGFQKEYMLAWKYKDIRDYLEKKFPDTNFRRHALQFLITDKRAENVFGDDRVKFLAIQSFIEEDPSLLTETFEGGKTLEILAMMHKEFKVAKYLCEKAEKTGACKTPQHYYDFQYWKNLGIDENIINESYKHAICKGKLNDVKRFIDKDPSKINSASTLFAIGHQKYEIAEYFVQEDQQRNNGKNNTKSFQSFKIAYENAQSSQSFANSFVGFFSTMSSGVNTGGYKEINHVITQLKKEGLNGHDTATKEALYKFW